MKNIKFVIVSILLAFVAVITLIYCIDSFQSAHGLHELMQLEWREEDADNPHSIYNQDKAKMIEKITDGCLLGLSTIACVAVEGIYIKQLIRKKDNNTDDTEPFHK